MKRMIRPYRVSTDPYRDEILVSFAEILDSGMFVLGEKTRWFEQVFAKAHGRKFGIAVNSDTSALEAALVLRGKTTAPARCSKLVLMPDTAFFGCANVAIRLGANVVAVPVEIENGTMPTLSQLVKTVEWAEEARSYPREEMIYMAVYNAGMVGVDAIPVMQWCHDEGIDVIEDCAHCHGATYTNGDFVGSNGPISTFSFYATKMVHSGEGGMLLLDDEQDARWLRMYRDYGKFSGKDADPVFAGVAMVGYNWRMTEFQAALGAIVWRHYDEIYRERRKVADVYDQFFLPEKGSCVELARRLTVSVGMLQPNLYRYILIVEGLNDRPQNHALWAKLKERGVTLQAKCNSYPLTGIEVFKRKLLFPPSKEAGQPSPEAYKYCMSHICLPIYPNLTEDDALFVAEAVRDVLSEGGWK